MDKTITWPIYKRLLRYSKKHWKFMAIASIGIAIEALAAGGFTLLMKPIIDQTFVTQNTSISWILPLSILGLVIIRSAASWLSDYGMARAGKSVVLDFRQQVMAKFLRMPSSQFDSQSVPALVSHLNYDAEQVAQASSEAIKNVLTDVLTIIVLISVMIYISLKVTLAVLIVVPIMAFIASRVGNRYRRINRGIQEGFGLMAQSAEQTLSAQQEVKIYGMQSAEERRFTELAKNNLKMGLKVEATRATASSVVQLMAGIALAVILIFASAEAMQGRMTAGSFVTLMTSMMAILPSLKRLTNVQSIIHRGVSASERLFKIIDQPDEPDLGTVNIERANGLIEYENVTVRYTDQSRAALTNLSFVAKPGTVTAVVGRSGSGKSTLIRMLPRFYDPSAGTIRLDGTDINDFSLSSLRNQIALVSQQVMLFDDTVLANVRFGKSKASDEEVWHALRAANATEFVEKLPDGIFTQLGERGNRLSGGQKQRIAIARAILKNAPILILDEATAALDNESERLVQDALTHLIPDRTTIIIAHRLSTVEHADQVLVLDEGMLVEVGTHAELLAKNGVYSHLHKMQFRETEQS